MELDTKTLSPWSHTGLLHCKVLPSVSELRKGYTSSRSCVEHLCIALFELKRYYLFIFSIFQNKFEHFLFQFTWWQNSNRKNGKQTFWIQQCFSADYRFLWQPGAWLHRYLIKKHFKICLISFYVHKRLFKMLFDSLLLKVIILQNLLCHVIFLTLYNLKGG